MRYFIDANIILDIWLKRPQFFENSLQIFKNIEERNWLLYTSDNVITTCYYMISKKINREESKRLIADFLVDLEIVPVSKQMLLNATISKISDYEDAVQFECAASIKGINGIITRNKKDFKHSTIPVFAPEEVLF
ncbi:type II toxin-antitoxin system VapC family toxin [Nonlabens marinus]|uniref:PIN domain protein n=1 Tax=Nonlabens marinus S1-08 TaxID=1454201 RepID=W8VND7_9FLAO|nr:PIN domain-containing protein [Nonlabens marinus]BAO54389.1 PIN domain protein [Nonlabens marinus S1-08]